ncbi:MAG: hypothetical protein ACHQ7N_16490 [Candidatus Methylomirabilales bacterium]
MHPETVRRALATERFARPAVTRPAQCDPYRAFLQVSLQLYPRLRGTRLFEIVRDRGYRGSVVQLRRVLRTLQPAPVAEAYLRLTLLPGEQGQADWGSFGRIRIGRATRSLSAFVLVPSWSRALHALRGDAKCDEVNRKARLITASMSRSWAGVATGPTSAKRL